MPNEAPNPQDRYQASASKNAAGEIVWRIAAVPIFAEHLSATSPKNIVNVDRAWLEKAVATAQERNRVNGYMGPLHVNHHYQGLETQRVGTFLPTEVRDVEYVVKDADGNPEVKAVATVFADLVDVDDATYQAIKRGELEYRSVEVNDIEEPEISTCALLADDTPYFRFPLLSKGIMEQNQDRRPRPVEAFRHKRGPVLAHAAKGRSMSFLYSERSNMAEKYEEKPPADKAPAPSEKAPTLSDVMDTLKKIGETMAEVSEYIKGKNSDDKPKEEPGEKPKGGPAEAPAKSGEKVSLDPAQLARVSVLEGEVAAMRSERELEERIKWAKGELAGYVLASDAEGQMRKMSKDQLQVFVDAVKKHGRKEPPTHPGARDDFAGNGTLPPEVMEYAKKGPEDLQRAISYAAEFPAHRGRYPGSLKQYIGARFAQDVVFAKEPK